MKRITGALLGIALLVGAGVLVVLFWEWLPVALVAAAGLVILIGTLSEG